MNTTVIQLLTLYTDTECHNARHYRWTEWQTDKQTHRQTDKQTTLWCQ